MTHTVTWIEGDTETVLSFDDADAAWKCFEARTQDDATDYAQITCDGTLLHNYERM